jgi:hypothetical protein
VRCHPGHRCSGTDDRRDRPARGWLSLTIPNERWLTWPRKASPGGCPVVAGRRSRMRHGGMRHGALAAEPIMLRLAAIMRGVRLDRRAGRGRRPVRRCHRPRDGPGGPPRPGTATTASPVALAPCLCSPAARHSVTDRVGPTGRYGPDGWRCLPAGWR